ncbi:MAG: hypothetical protein ACKPKO_45730, partial [Candidatus Fonsibacter sp.]
ADAIKYMQPSKETARKEMEHIMDYFNASPGVRAQMLRPSLVSASGRPNKRQGTKKNGGLEAILEHHDIKNDPYYMKPPLPTHIK